MTNGSLFYCISVYTDLAQAANRSKRYIETVTAAVTQFNNYLGECPDIATITANDLRGFIRHLQVKPKWDRHPTIRKDHGTISASTVANRVRHIKSFFVELAAAGIIDHNPLQTVKTPKTPRKLPDILTPAEVERLCAVIPRDSHQGYRDLVLISILYGLGLRVSEALGLLLDDIDFETGAVRIMGKGSKERRLYMGRTVAKAMALYIHRWRPGVGSRYVFIHTDGRPLDRHYVAHRLSRYQQQAGIRTRVTAHVFRHSFATAFYRATGDPFALQAALGHESLQMTLHYTRVTSEDLEHKLKNQSPAEKLHLDL